MPTYSETITDGFSAADAFGSFCYGVTRTEGVDFTEATLSYAFQAGALVTERLGWASVAAVSAIHGLTVAEVVGWLDSLVQHLPVTITDGMALGDVLAVARAVVVLERLGFLDSLATNSMSQLALLDAVIFDDALIEFFGFGSSDSLGFADSFTPTFQFSRVNSDGFGLADALLANTLFMRVITDGVDFDEALTPQMIYDGQLSDMIGIKIGWLDPGGGFTAWAINTRNNAVTEYRGWGPFNSFCQIGNQIYGASSEGLFLLNAETDDGADICADIKGAMLSLGGSRYTQLDGVYLGMRVDDNAREFVLKLIQPNAGPGGTDKIYLYKFRPRNMRTTKVNIGKGLRARYLQWELVTPGADFDLDSIEFVPVVSRRRV